MSTSDQSGIVQLAKEIGDIYLNESFSDVTIIIDGTELPAHRMILSQRCPYFKTMFSSGMIESTSKRIELRETPIDGFKAVLKWIYTGEIEFSQMDTALEVHRLSNMYQLLELEKLACQYIEANCSIDNLCLILNNASSLSRRQDMIVNCHKNGSDFLAHETFLTLSKEGLDKLLRSELIHIINVEFLEGLVRWMKANPDQSEHFPDLCKLIPLNSISLGELVSIVPSELISANVVMEVAREQQTMYESGQIEGINFATPKYGAKTIIGGKSVFFSNRFFQQDDVNTEEVVIDLGQRFKLSMFVADRAIEYPEPKRIDIFVSTDGVNWTCVVHQQIIGKLNSEYFFDERAFRFIRICGDRPLNEVLELDAFSAYYE